MTREDVVNSYGYKVAKASVDYSQKYAKDDELQGIVMDTFENAAKFGYNLALNKACEWLDCYIDNYLFIDAENKAGIKWDDFINDFRKAMKGAQCHYIDGAHYADAHPHWISVEDELPKNFKIKEGSYYAGKFEETDIVMVAFDDGDFGFARYVHDFPDAEEGEAWYWFAEGNLSGVNLDDGDVTHWMPLPQPPKKGGEE